MKPILILLSVVCLFFSCRKNIDKLTPAINVDTPKLFSIIGDTDSSFNAFYYYTDTRITDIYLKPLSYSDSFHFAHLEYSEDNYIKVTDPENELRYTEYYLTAFKLPLTIIKHSDILNETETINFYYKQDTNLLDSIADSLTHGYYSMHYKFNYEEGNVSDILITQSYSGGSGEYSLHYTYDTSTPNIFRQTDSLLYVYTDPFAREISTTYIPRNLTILSSVSTFQTISFLGDPYYSYSDTLNYTLNSNGKIFQLGYNGSVGATYSYH